VHFGQTVNVTPRDQYDVLGVPLLSPAYSFGLRPESPISKDQRGTAPTSLKTIASVTAVRHDYDVYYAGEETIDGAACYVLMLMPRREPAVFRLRKLWVDELTFETHQALLDGNFTAGPGPSLPWLVRFTNIAGATYIKDETAAAPVHYLGRTMRT
jgi:hypothetical protein